MMQTVCQAIPDPEHFAPGVIRFLDCQAQTLGAQGYQALTAPGSPAAVLLTGLVTILVALFGYRMLLGHVPSIREGVLTFVKLGIVLLLATSWPAYQVLLYDVVLRAPADLVASIGGATGLPGATGGLVDRLDAVDQALKSLALQGVGSPPIGPDGRPLGPSVAPSPFPGFDSYALGYARVGFLVTSVGAFAIVRIAGGLLLALGPLFAGFLLFDGSRGLFEGWLKALIAVALVSVATAVVLGVQLALYEPWLATLLARRAAGLDAIGAPAQLFAASIIFGFALLAVGAIVARVAMSLRIPRWLPAYGPAASDTVRSAVGATGTTKHYGIPIESRSRAAAVAEAVTLSQRREASAASNTPAGNRIGSGSLSARQRDAAVPSVGVRGGATGRRTARRISAGASTRDRRR